MLLSAAEFKGKCLSLMDQVQSSQEEIIITKHGKPVAKLVAVEHTSAAHLFGYMKGRIKQEGDVVESLGLRWNAEK